MEDILEACNDMDEQKCDLAIDSQRFIMFLFFNNRLSINVSRCGKMEFTSDFSVFICIIS